MDSASHLDRDWAGDWPKASLWGPSCCTWQGWGRLSQGRVGRYAMVGRGPRGLTESNHRGTPDPCPLIKAERGGVGATELPRGVRDGLCGDPVMAVVGGRLDRGT